MMDGPFLPEGGLNLPLGFKMTRLLYVDNSITSISITSFIVQDLIFQNDV